MSTTAKRVIKNTGYIYAKMAITMFISILTTRFVLKGLGVVDFGIYGITLGVIGLLGFFNSAMSSATQRFMSYAEGEGKKENLKSIFNTSIILHLIIAIIVSVLLFSLGDFFFDRLLNIPENRQIAAKVIYISLIISVAITIINVPYTAVLNAHENMRYYAIIGIFESILKFIVAIICLHSKADKLIVFGILMAFIPFITTMIMKVYCHKKYDECCISLKLYCNKETMSSMSKFAGWNLIPSISSMATQYGFSIVLNHFHGVTLNAAHGIAGQLSGQLMTFSSNMLGVLSPIITKKEGAGERQQMLNIAMIGSKFSFYILGCLAIPIMLQMSKFLNLWLGDVPEWAVCFTILQLLRNLTEQLTITLNNAIAAQGNIKPLSRATFILNILPLILTYIVFYYNFPPYWMFIFWIICWSIIKGGLLIYYAHIQCELDIIMYIKGIIFPALKVSSISVFVGLIPCCFEGGIYINIVSFFMSFFTFLLCVWYIGCNQKERCLILNIIKTMKKKLL